MSLQLVQNDESKLKVRFNPVFIKIFLYVILLAGVFNIYKMLMGHQVDQYGTFLFFILPLVLLSFVFCKVVIEVVGEDVFITRYYFLRRKKEAYQRKDIKGFTIVGGRGGNSAGTYSLIMQLKDQDIPIVRGFASLGRSAKSEAFSQLNSKF